MSIILIFEILIIRYQFILQCELPNARLYVFDGSISVDGQSTALPLSNKNLLLRGCVVRQVARVVGVVVYTGIDAKAMRNAVRVPAKRSSLERQIDGAIVALFLVDIALVVFAGFFGQRDPHHERWYIHAGSPALAYAGTTAAALFNVVSYIIIMNQLIPLSLYVTLELIKVTQAQLIERDDS